jgi:hypothetical protein
MSLCQLHSHDGSWSRLKHGWAEQCTAAGEEFDVYAQGSFLVLNQLAEAPQKKAGSRNMFHARIRLNMYWSRPYDGIGEQE